MRYMGLWAASLLLALSSANASAGPVWRKGVTLPVVVEGSACNSSLDKIGLSSSNLILSCQLDGGSTSWKWQTGQGGGKTGLQGLFFPMRGKTISCSVNHGGVIGSGSATVDTNGNITLGSYWSGLAMCATWTYCTNVPVCSRCNNATTSVTVTGISVSNAFGETCSASWPPT